MADGDATAPLEFGTASSTGFNPSTFVLNDDWATDTVTLKNGITGSNGDSSTPSLKIYSGAADAVIEGSVSGVSLMKSGAGKLSLRGASNTLGTLYPRGGTLVIAPPDGASRCSLSLAHIYNNTANAGAVVVSNATITQTGSGLTQTWYGGTTHTVENLVGSGVVSNGTLVVTGAVWPGVGDSGILKIDATATISFASIGCSVTDNGTCGCLLVDGTVDLAGVAVVGENLENKREGRGLTIVRASAISGRPATATIDGLRVSTTQNTLMIGASSTVILVQ